MRTRTERREARDEILKAVDDHDVMIVRAILEVCDTLEDLGEQLARANDAVCSAVDDLGAEFAKQAAGVQ